MSRTRTYREPSGRAIRRSAAVWLAVLAGLGPVPLRAAAGTTRDLDTRAKRRAAAEVKRCGKKYSAYIDSQQHVVYLSTLDDDHLRRTIGMLNAHAAAYRTVLPCSRPPWNIVVALIAADDYERLMPPLRAAAGTKVSGIYEPTTHRVTSIDRGEVLRHEFTHALHHADACAARQSHPIWLREGLAMLFQDARITNSGLEPVLDAELWTLQQALREKKAIPFEQFFRMGPTTFLKTPQLSYAQAKYVLYYLHHRQRLREWYQRYKATFSRDPSGQKAFEAILGNRTETLEKQWKEWVAALRYQGNPHRTGQGRLGLKMANDRRGVKVTGLLEGGAARRAGRLRVGDVIQKFNGAPTRNVAELSAAIRAAGAMRTVPIELLRDGHKKTVYQPLDAPEEKG